MERGAHKIATFVKWSAQFLTLVNSTAGVKTHKNTAGEILFNLESENSLLKF